MEEPNYVTSMISYGGRHFGGWYMQGDFEKMELKWKKLCEEVQV